MEIITITDIKKGVIDNLKKITDPGKVYRIFFNPGEVTEVRAFGLHGKNKAWDGYSKNTVYGYFNNPDDFCKALRPLEEQKASGVYFTFNPSNPALIARAQNRLKATDSKSSLTTDKDIIKVRWLPIDLDPVRPSGVSSTVEELNKALELQKTIARWLEEEFGIIPGIFAMSGNGAHLLVRIEDTSPEKASPIIKDALKAIAYAYPSTDTGVEVDQSVYNPARIWKAYGTTARKGDSTKDRPHRMAYILDTGITKLDDIPVNSLDKIRRLIEILPKTETKTKKTQNKDNRLKSGILDVPAYLKHYGVEVIKVKEFDDGIMYCLKHCVFDPNHTPNESAIIQFNNGSLRYQCFHNSCKDKTWQDARKAISGDDSLKQFMIDINKTKSPVSSSPSSSKHIEDKKPIRKPILTPLSHFQAEEVKWLWKPYLPIGKVCLLEGDPGVGKTWISLYMCTKLIREGRTVVYATCEDGIADTLKPRVELIIGDDSIDLDRFLILEGNQNEDGTIEPFTVKDLNPVEYVLNSYHPSLFVLDPMQGFIGEDVDIYKANEVRTRLNGLVQLGKEYNCTFLLIRHLAKASQKAIYKGLGSIDFSALARSILLIGQKDKQIILTHSKSSLAEKGASLAFEIKDGHFWFVGETDVTVSDLLNVEDEKTKTALEEAEDFLKEILSSGAMSAAEVKKEAKNVGISEKTLNRAKAKLGIKTKPTRNERGKISGWTWSLPPDGQLDNPDDHPSKYNFGHLGNWSKNPYKCYFQPDGQKKLNGHLDKSKLYQDVTNQPSRWPNLNKLDDGHVVDNWTEVDEDDDELVTVKFIKQYTDRTGVVYLPGDKLLTNPSLAQELIDKGLAVISEEVANYD